MIVDNLKKSLYLASFQGKLSKQKVTDSNVAISLNKLINQKKINNKEIKRRKINDRYTEIYKLPPTWKWVKLGYLCDIIRGLTFSNSYKEKKDNTVLVLRGGNIDSKTEELTYDNNIYVDCTIPNSNQYLHLGDTLIVASSGTKTSVGKSAYIYKVEKDISFGGFMMVIRPYKEIVNPKYVSYQIKMYRNKIINSTNGYISNITNEILNNLLIPLPPIEEQQRIVDKIEELFAKLDEIKPIEDELEMIKSTFPDNMRKSILNDSFSGTANFINEDYENWESDLIINIADICTGNSIPESVKKNKYANTEIGYNYIATKDLLFNHTFNYNNGIKIPYSEKGFKYASKNDILMCIEGGSAGKKIGILDEKVCYGNKLCKFSIKNDSVIPKFLYYYLQSNVFLKNFYENLNGIIGGVSVNKIKKIIVKYPSISEQKLIVEKIEQLLSICDDIDNIVKN